MCGNSKLQFLVTCICINVESTVQWDMYVQCGKHICSGVYANNVKCMYTSASGHVFECTEFI